MDAKANYEVAEQKSQYSEEDITLGRAAVAYATAGVKVFPLQKHDKIPVTSKEFGLLHGHNDSSSDPRIVRAWWMAFPGSNIGIPGNDEFFILDVDTYNGGGASLDGIVSAHSELPYCPTVETGGGGKHYYFAQPAGSKKVGTRNGFVHGLDAKGIGGYVVAPPSIHPNGNSYVWEDDASVITAEAPQAPGWLLEILPIAAPPGVRAKLTHDDWAAISSPVAQGDGRHSTLLSLAGKLVPQLGPKAARTLLTAWNLQLCSPPLEEPDFNRILHYIYQKERSRHA